MQHIASRSRAFTLIELIIVMSIIAISAVVVAPMLAPRDDVRAESAVRKIVADLNYAQSMAIATQRPWFVRFNAGGYDLATESGGTFTVASHPITQVPFVVGIGPASDEPQLRPVTLGAVSFDGEMTIAFDALGTPYAWDGSDLTPLSASGSIVITSGSFTRTVTVQPITGEVSFD